MNVIEKIETQLNGNAIYKFMPFNIYSLETIINKKLYFGDPNFQNDPVENSCKINIDNLPDNYGPYYRKKYSDNVNKESLITWIQFNISYQLFERIGISCFSEKYDEYLLWSHYADAAKGICFIFDKAELMDSLKKENDSLIFRKVEYNGIPTISPKPKVKAHSFDFDLEEIIFNKRVNWKYEDEVRAMCKLKVKDEFENDMKRRLLSFTEISLKGIILGERFEKFHIETLKNTLQNCYKIKVPLISTQRNRDNPEILDYY